MAFTAFLSCSFNRDDSEVVFFFRRLLEDCGFNVLTAQKDDAPSITRKIYPKIDKSDIIFGIFSRRHKLENNHSHVPPSAVVFEMGYAIAKNKPVFGFCEDGIDFNELGLMQFNGKTFPRFNKNNLDEKRKEFSEFISSLSVVQDGKIRGAFDFTNYVKDVTIYSNGYGVVRMRCSIKTRTESFKSIPHMFGLGDSASRTLTLPSFEALQKAGPKVRYGNKQKPFFNFRLVEGRISKEDISIIPQECKKNTIKFLIRFPQMDIGSILTYEWAWGSYGLFPVSQEDLKPGKRKKDLDHVCSTLPSITNDLKDFVFVLRFEGSPNFIQEPIINTFDSAGDLMEEKPFEKQKSALYTNFVAKQLSVQIQGGHIHAYWIPK